MVYDFMKNVSTEQVFTNTYFRGVGCVCVCVGGGGGGGGGSLGSVKST